MFKDKRFLILFIVETIMPWIVAILGVIDVRLFVYVTQYESSPAFDIMYHITMGYGIAALVFFLITGFVAFVLMLVNLFGAKKEKYSVARPLVIWLYSTGCIFGTIIFMFLTAGFTYGMSV